MQTRHALILAINTSILIVLFAFSAWLYVASKAEVEQEVSSALDRAAAMTERLCELREKELSGLAQSIAVSPMLRGALSTGDGPTIRDVLATFGQKNGLALVSVGRHRWGADGPGGLLLGRTALSEGSGELTVGVAPDRALLDPWSEISGARVGLRAGKGAVVHNLPSDYPAGTETLVRAGDTRFYRRGAALLDGRFQGEFFLEYAPYWSAFERRRDSLAVLGGGLFFFGLLLSVGFAELIARGAEGPGGASRPAELAALLDEIEGLRAGLSRPKA